MNSCYAIKVVLLFIFRYKKVHTSTVDLNNIILQLFWVNNLHLETIYGKNLQTFTVAIIISELIMTKNNTPQNSHPTPTKFYAKFMKILQFLRANYKCYYFWSKHLEALMLFFDVISLEAVILPFNALYHYFLQSREMGMCIFLNMRQFVSAKVRTPFYICECSCWRELGRQY